jgi:tetratricopeptide (TPR) repeat protein
MLKKTNWLVVFLLSFIMGCTSIDQKTAAQEMIVLNVALFTPTEPVISEQDIYELTKVQQEEFLNFFQLQISKRYLPHEIISNFFENKLSNFSYYGKTYTASNAMAKNSGNCMSLAILTTAFSRLIDVEMDYQKMHSLPVYEKHGNVLLSSSHVQSILYDPSFLPDGNFNYLSRPSITIDYFPQEDNLRSKIINGNKFLSMFYVNKASEFYIESDFDSAFYYTKKAYHLDIESVSAMNLLALLHKKKGDEDTAEQLYLSAMKSKDNNISILDNYVNLLKGQGRFKRANFIKQRIENIYDPNPYHWLEKAQFAVLKREYNDAERFYRKVIKLAPYVKQAYLELHEVYLLQDKKKQAITMLQQSLLWLHEPKQKRKYKKQLYQLSQTI